MPLNRISLLAYLTRIELTRKYTGTAGGVIYTILAPMTLIVVMWFALDYGLGLRALIGEDFGLKLIVGMTLWISFAEAISDSITVITRNPHFIKKMVFPVELLPFSSVTAAFSVHIMILSVVSAGLYWGDHFETSQIWMLPMGFMLTVMFSLAIAMLVSSLSVIVRDVQVVTPVILSIWFWVTPLIWSVDRVPEKWHWLFIINPMALAVEAYRSALLGTSYPFEWQIVVASIIFVAGLFGVGLFMFSTLRPSFANNM